jgi:DUF1365 family protein
MESRLNSCLYECRLMHHRRKPKRHHFEYRVFLFYVDLDELGVLARKLRLVSLNRFNLYSFSDSDHLWKDTRSVRDKLRSYLHSEGVELGGGRVFLLTYFRTLGYLFNPVSFYFCFNEAGQPLCVVPEVCNTFGEMKTFCIGKRNQTAEGVFLQRTAKHFYVSPFMDLDVDFEFQLQVPGEELEIRIDDIAKGERIFFSSLRGVRKPLTDSRLAWFTLKYPWMTARVIFAIHWQALRLFLKGLPYHRKAAHERLQQGRIRQAHPHLAGATREPRPEV